MITSLVDRDISSLHSARRDTKSSDLELSLCMALSCLTSPRILYGLPLGSKGFKVHTIMVLRLELDNHLFPCP